VENKLSENCASLIEDARFILIEGMAHNMPEDIIPKLVSEMTSHMGAVETTQLAMR